MSKRARSATIANLCRRLARFDLRGINEERSGSDYSEFRSQCAALARRTLLDEYGCSELQRNSIFSTLQPLPPPTKHTPHFL